MRLILIKMQIKESKKVLSRWVEVGDLIPKKLPKIQRGTVQGIKPFVNQIY